MLGRGKFKFFHLYKSYKGVPRAPTCNWLPKSFKESKDFHASPTTILQLLKGGDAKPPEAAVACGFCAGGVGGGGFDGGRGLWHTMGPKSTYGSIGMLCEVGCCIPRLCWFAIAASPIGSLHPICCSSSGLRASICMEYCKREVEDLGCEKLRNVGLPFAVCITANRFQTFHKESKSAYLFFPKPSI